MARRIDTRLSLLEMWSSDTGQKVIVDDRTQGKMWYLDGDGDHHYLTDEDYQRLKSSPGVTLVVLEYASHWRGQRSS